MTCKEFEERVHDFVRMALLDVNEREVMLEHAAWCAQCSERLAEAIALAEVSRVAGDGSRAGQAPLRVEAVVVAAFREQHRRQSWRRTFEWAAVGAAAAVLLLVFVWIAGGGSKTQPTPVEKSAPASQPVIPLDANASGVSKTPEAAEVAEPVSAGSRRALAYAASDFVPVPFAGGIAADDPGMIVRVQLTRASLAQLGYPVAEVPGEELISADVLVGEDGWPRGVKLIQ